MRRKIKEYWNDLKTQYKEEYNQKIFKDYDTSRIFVEKFQKYLYEMLAQYPKDVDIVCILASVEQELRCDNISMELLENFIDTYKEELSDIEKSRIFTNLAFYYDGYPKRYEYLLKAEKLNSPFFETYKGLALHCFSNYEYDDLTDDLKKSSEIYEKAIKVNDCYEARLGYAVCLFEMGEYQKSKEIFENLLSTYPNRMRIMLSVAYCEIYLGNLERAMKLIKEVKDGQDENYYLNTDDIGDYQIYDAYYILEEYDLFLEECEKALSQYYLEDGDYYYYSLWITKRYEKFEEKISEQKKLILDWIEETKADEYFTDEEERQAYIKSYEESLEKLIEIEHKIKNENYKPIVKLRMYPEFGCYLIDCIRHNF